VEKAASLPKIEEFFSPVKAPVKKEKRETFTAAYIIKTQLKKHRNSLIVLAPVLLIGLVLAGYGFLQENRRQPMDGPKKIVAKTPTENDSSALPDTANKETNKAGVSIHKVPDQASVAVENSDKEMAKDQEDSVLNQTSDIYFNAARRFSENRYWEVALEYCQNVLEINPDYPELSSEIARIQFEIANLAHYEQGVAYIKEGRYEDGIATLKNIFENSVYHAEVGQRIEKALKKQEQKKSAEAQAARDKKASSGIASALQYYADGKIKSSLKHLYHILQSGSHANPKLKSRATILRKRINYSQSLYNKGNEEYANGQRDMAMETWKQLLKVDQKLISGKHGYFTKSVSQKMADEYSSKAFGAYSEGDWPGAYKYNKMALNLKSNHAKSLQIKKMLLEKSKQLFHEGYILEEYNPEKAMEKWKQILKICGPENEYYKKALMRISAR
ncbi:MAG: hypothetical protein PVJ19_18985, partial [Desulfobacteraceae bacterium]